MKTVLIIAVIVIMICLLLGDGLHKTIQRIMNGTHTKLLPKADARKPSKPTDASDYDPTKFGKYNKPRR